MATPKTSWFRVSAHYDDDDAIFRTHALAELAFIRMCAASKRMRTAGFIPRKSLARVTVRFPSTPDEIQGFVAELVEEGLLLDTGDGWQITSWDVWQDDDETIADQAERKSAKASQSAHARWHNEGKHLEPVDGCPLCERNAPACDTHKSKNANACSEQTQTQNRHRTEKESQLPAPTLSHSDVDVDLVNHLLARYANHAGTNPLKAADRQLEDMRLLRQRGPTTWANPTPIEPNAIASMIDWVFDHAATPSRDGFCWANNIRSAGSLRDKWDQLINARNVNGRRSDENTTAIALVREMQNEGIA